VSKFHKFFIAGMLWIPALSTKSQLSEAKLAPGIWQYFGVPGSKSQYPILEGRLCNFTWAEIEPSNNVWNWTSFDQGLKDGTKDGLPVIFMVYTKEDAPEWIYSAGVPKVPESDNNGNVIGYSPYFADADYKSYFNRMIQKVHSHVETLAASIRNNIIGVQACFGSTGDYISYKGEVPSRYYLDSKQFLALYQEFTQYYYTEYKNTSPKIYLMSNPRNQGSDAAIWTEDNCPGWQKTGTLGKGFQLNDEVDKNAWLYNMMNKPKGNGEYMRTRSELSGSNTSSGWWKKAPYKNMFATMCYAVRWGLDWNNQTLNQINDSNNDSSIAFFSRYAGQKDPAKSTNAMCALKDVLDAKDGVRFPAATYGTVSQTNKQRYINIANKFTSKGALLEDVTSATGSEMDNIRAKGTNDVGWNLFPGNYDRFLHQLIANETSIGYWNISSAETNSRYGKFGRGFDVANNKKALYFDVDNAFLSNTALNGQYSVTIEVTYLDKGTGGWQLYYDAQTGRDKASTKVTCTNTNKWKKTTITLANAYFGNRGSNASDFSIRSTSSSQNVIFSVVELSRPANFASQTSKSNLIAGATNTSEATALKIDTDAKDQLLVNPNPVRDHFYIQTKNNQLLKQVMVYNQAGQLIMQKLVSGLRIAINRNEMGGAAGIYFIKVSTGTSTYSGKVTVL
jgi:hypothetical protein